MKIQHAVASLLFIGSASCLQAAGLDKNYAIDPATLPDSCPAPGQDVQLPGDKVICHCEDNEKGSTKMLTCVDDKGVEQKGGCNPELFTWLKSHVTDKAKGLNEVYDKVTCQVQ